ncbi:MAG: hypothetical protein ACP6IS_11180 [Candidatus Asgardarchaeia archaeon]
MVLLNAFKIEPDVMSTNVIYCKPKEGVSITKAIGEIRKELGLAAGGLTSNYAGLKAGIYIITTLDSVDISELEAIGLEDFKEIPINSSAYVMKYIVAEGLRKKALENPNLKKLRSKSITTYIFYFTDSPLYKSKVGTFSIYKGFEYRVEYIRLGDVDNLYLVLNYRLVVNANYTFKEIINQLKKYKSNLLILKGLPCKVKMADSQGNLSFVSGYIANVDENGDIVKVKLDRSSKQKSENVIETNPEDVLLLSNYSWYSSLLQKLGDDVQEIEEKVGYFSHTRCRGKAIRDAPKKKWEAIQEIIKKISQIIFPLKIGNVTYTLNLNKPLTL